MIRGSVCALLLGCGGFAWAGEMTLSAGQGDGYATFGVDEMGQIKGCGGYGIQFDPFGDLESGQASCRSVTYLFDQGAQWRQSLANGVWVYHPDFDPNVHSCEGTGRPTDVLQTDEHVLQDEVIGDYRRHTRFVVASHPELSVDLDQYVCGATLFQTYRFTNDGLDPVDMIVTRYFDADLYFDGWFTQNTAGGVDEDNQAVRIASKGGAVGLTIDASGDVSFEGWRAWHDAAGGATDFARLTGQDGFFLDELNAPFHSTGGPYCLRSQAEGGTLTDVGIGVQGTLSLAPGQSGVFGSRTAMDPGKVPDDSVEILGVTATPAVLPLTRDNVDVTLDVALDGCGVCAITDLWGDEKDVAYTLTGALSAQVLADREQQVSFEIACTTPGGEVVTGTATVPVERQACNQGLGNGAEGCDPGNSNQGDPSRTNDEDGQLPGQPGKR